MKTASHYAARLRRRLQGRRLARLHRCLVPPARLTVSEITAAAACLGVSPDDVLSGNVDVVKVTPRLAEGQRFLDITHPGHGVALGDLDADSATAVLGVAAANFFGASMASTLSRLTPSTISGGAWPGAFSQSPAPEVAAAPSSPPSAP